MLLASVLLGQMLCQARAPGVAFMRCVVSSLVQMACVVVQLVLRVVAHKHHESRV